jgi:hypothetical protein
MNALADGYIEEEVIVDGVRAIRKRKAPTPRKAKELYLHVPMTCITAIAEAKIPAKAWPLALWIIWHHKVSSGKAATISETFAIRAGIATRAGRRHAIDALAANNLFEVTRNGKEAVRISLGKNLVALLGRDKK